MEARHQLEESHGQGTINDRSFVGAMVRKWAPYLRSIEGRDRRDVSYRQGLTAILMENQLGDMQRILNEDTTTARTAEYKRFLFPILRRVFPNLIANEIVSVQPMTAPVGAVFYYEYKYSTTKGSATAEDNLIESLHTHYSSEFIDEELLATGDGAKYGGVGEALAASLAWFPVRAQDDDAGWVVTITDGDQVATDDGAGGFEGDATAGAINYTTGAITGFLFTAAPDNEDEIVASYWYNSEMNEQIPEIDIEVTLETVKAGSRKLRTRWSSEATDDMRALHGLDAEAEIVNGVSQQMALEIDREIIADLVANAAYSDTYDFTPGDNQTELDAIRGLLTVIGGVSASIHRGTKRGQANFIVTSPEVWGYLDQLSTHGDFLPAFAANPAQAYAGQQTQMRAPSYGDLTSDFGVMFVGTLSRRYRVYVDPYLAATTVLVGFKGRSYLDAGYVYAPYIPLQMTQTLEDPDDFSRRKGLRTRYAKKVLRGTHYGVITITFPS
jgi:hypothetical protein